MTTEEEREEIKRKREARKKLERKDFNRQDAGKYKKFANRDKTWRRPKGRHSKLRRERGVRQKVKVGRRKPQHLRDVHPCGRKEVLIHNPQELETVDPETEAARIAAKVGQRKRQKIREQAEEKDIKLLN